MICSDPAWIWSPTTVKRETRFWLEESGQRRVGEVQVPGGGEVRRELDADQAVLLAQRDRHAAGLHRRLGARPPDHHAAVALDVEDAPVGGDVELHRVRGVVVERDLLEVGRAGGRHALGTAVRRGRAGHRPDAAEQVLAERRARRTSRSCGPCPCTTSGRRRSSSTTRSGGRRRGRRCRRPRRRSTRRPWPGRGRHSAGCSRRRLRRRRPEACSCTTRPCGSSGREPSPSRGVRCPRCRPTRSACRPGARRSSPRRGRRTSPSRTRCRRPHGCRRSRCRPGCSARTRPAARP